jgi:lysophospholipase L1-like esterase
LLSFIVLLIKDETDSMISQPASVKRDTTMTFLALGDSYTIGEAVDLIDRFPVQTIDLLARQNIYFNPPEIIAATGWTTTDLLNALNTHLPKNNYTIVSLLIGVNNQYQHKSVDEYKTEFAELLERAVSYAGEVRKHVFALSIPDYSVTPFATNLERAQIAKEINEFNSANKTISLSAGVHYLDVTAISREAQGNSSLTASDGLHPSALQYSLWSEQLAGEIRKALQWLF